MPAPSRPGLLTPAHHAAVVQQPAVTEHLEAHRPRRRGLAVGAVAFDRAQPLDSLTNGRSLANGVPIAVHRPVIVSPAFIVLRVTGEPVIVQSAGGAAVSTTSDTSALLLNVPVTSKDVPGAGR